MFEKMKNKAKEIWEDHKVEVIAGAATLTYAVGVAAGVKAGKYSMASGMAQAARENRAFAIDNQGDGLRYVFSFRTVPIQK